VVSINGNVFLLFAVLIKEEITAEEDEEQLIMRRLRNSVDELRREFRLLDYKMQRIKGKAEQAKDAREKIELHEDKVQEIHIMLISNVSLLMRACGTQGSTCWPHTVQPFGY
jgi:hypothetical protein